MGFNRHLPCDRCHRGFPVTDYSLVYELWKLIQTDSIYKNTTTLFITNDHGRHTTDFAGHRDQCDGCRHIMLMALGPDVKAGEVDSVTRYQIDIAPTIGMLLGYSTKAGII
jgi:arylsulfatase A-like enzyme